MPFAWPVSEELSRWERNKPPGYFSFPRIHGKMMSFSDLFLVLFLSLAPRSLGYITSLRPALAAQVWVGGAPRGRRYIGGKARRGGFSPLG